MSEERELVKKRASFKGRLTSFTNYLETLSDQSFNNSDITELQLRITKIESLYKQYDEVQLRMECITEDVKIQLAERSEFELLYFKSLSKAQNIVIDFTNKINSVVVDNTNKCNIFKPVKLPTIQLPKFSGSYCHWLEFRDTFTSLIDSNDNIDQVNKFHYLRASLEESAAVIIKSVEFSANNYSIAWQLLCDRFDNKRLLVQNHVSALFNIDPIIKESSIIIKGLIDQLNKNLRALESLGEPVKYWDTLLMYIVSRKLDHKTFREWEECKGRLDKDEIITFDNFIKFLHSRANLIETLEMSRSQSHKAVQSQLKVKSMVVTQASHSFNTEVAQKLCVKCKGHHNLSECSQFLALSNEARLKLLPSYKVCFNCFKSGHFANNCKKPGCKLCKRKHSTLIHISDFKSYNNNEHKQDNTSSTIKNLPSTSLTTDTCNTSNVPVSTNVSLSCSHRAQHDVLLSTALIKLYNNNRTHIVRAVLDSGSTSCFITEKLCKLLKLATSEVDRSILGINNVSSHVGKICHVDMTSLNDSFSCKLHCFVLPLITDTVPCREINISELNIPTNICLADPTFYKPSDIDILIGADLFWDLIGSLKIKLGNGKPILCETKLGWIVCGPTTHNYVSMLSNEIRCNFTKITSKADDDWTQVKSDLSRFWDLEEVNYNSSHYLPEEKLCEDHFIKNTTRLSNGSFCVRVPLKQNPSILGDSFKRASQCFYSLERRLSNKSDFSDMYYEFMSEYEQLGHMIAVKTLESSEPLYYIPHHGVLRESSSTTKLRVVFNASCPTSSGVSLNDIQMVGPTVQDDMLSILLRFRQHKYVLSADVAKMYRTIQIHPSDRHLQRVVWRGRTDDKIKIYELNTVTYGTASAPFLATRCLKQIGMECKDPIISEIIQHDFWIDDLLTGGDSLDEVQFIRKEVTNALASACMPLRKWKSNEPILVSESVDSPIDLIGSTEPNKLLGLTWYAGSDELGVSVNSDITVTGNTKRELLSLIARIFDPLGLLSPCIIIMKMFLQKMWLDKLSWDEPLTPEIQTRWKSIVTSLPILNSFRIPRNVFCDLHKELEVHVFSDASERAYGACIYIRSFNSEGEYQVRLLMAKSRVAPIKPTTIPRLELCGAVIGARLCQKVRSSLRANINRIYCWTDSTIVLGWLQMLPSRLQPFVRNRVAEVLDKAANSHWRHVPTNLNPADLISRGVDIKTLRDLDLWWSGPNFLRQDICNWPSQYRYQSFETLPELRPEVALSAVVDGDSIIRFIDFTRFSSYTRLVRSIAYVLRFIKLCRKQTIETEFLSDSELQDATHVLIYQSQIESFPEHKLLINNNNLPKKSVLQKFNVYLDAKKIMRVGGRLDNSDFSYEKRHPIILQSTHEFTKLLFSFEHKRLMHAGPQLLLASIRESYWPIGGRNLAKVCFHQCVLCRRIKGKTVTPLMGNLPRHRITPGCPFQSTGVDYAGPVMCATRQGRGCRLVKVYIAIFICFATKAMHLELVGDLTSNSYLLALYRFISRRGKPINIYSDNGTSFVGAYNEISKFFKTNSSTLGESLANDGIQFHFIPAYSPHFGGLWEAGVKSTKYHLQRVLGNCNLTFEELYTTLTQIEAVLNSRPLTPLSSDPADCTPLTPGHFLIGRPLTSLPCPNIENSSESQLSRFQRVEQLRQHFWRRWSKEYVAELQQRTKWRSCKDGLQLNTLVVLKEDSLPPLKWRLGRVVAVYPGSDGIVRVADIKTSTGITRRAFNRICPLPVYINSG